jgi:hypothetical protein
MSEEQAIEGRIEPSQERPPLGLRPNGQFTRLGMFFAAVLGTTTVATCLPLGIAGIVLSSMAQNRVATAPARARKLQAWSWSLFVVWPGLLMILLVAVALDNLATS